MAVDSVTFKLAMSKFASGVTIVTTKQAGVRYGMTVASFASVSLEPPLVLVCIGNGSTSVGPIRLAQTFAVNVLSAAQQSLGARFGGRADDVSTRFDEGEWFHLVTGSPVLKSALASVDCKLVATYDGGDHTVFVGEVVAAAACEGEPLLYFGRDWRALAS